MIIRGDMIILFATSNKNKAHEIAKLLPAHIKILTLDDLDLKEEIPETSPTIEGNAIQKANYIKEHYGIDCFADDTGLEVNVLNGEPGVHSARYAGKQRSDSDNIDLLLERLAPAEDRSARFKTVIALNIGEQQHIFEGIVNGAIRKERKGEFGFGYDSVFEPENIGKTFGEMTTAEKNQYSHRARAMAKMIAFLKTVVS